MLNSATDTDKKFHVYIHALPKEVSGYKETKYYVGITSREPKKRWGRGGCRYKKLPRIGEDIKKFGWDSFIHRVVFTVDGLEKAYRMEQILVALLKSNHSDFGYNRTDGGGGTLGYVYTEQQLKERSEQSARKWKNPEYRKKMTGENSYFASHKYVFSGKDSPKAKKVVCVNTGEVFGCIKDAARKYNTDNSQIGKCCKGKLLHAGKDKNGNGLEWRYYQEKEAG